MAKSTYDVNFYCNKAKASKKTGEAPIYLSIIINGNRELFPLPQKCKPEEFPKLMASKKDNPIKTYCSTVVKKLDELKLQMMETDTELTASSLREFFERGAVKKGYTINDVFTEFLAICHKRIGHGMIQDVYNKYERSLEYFKTCNNLTGEESIKTITNTHVLTMQAHVGKDFKTSTAAGYLAKVRTVFKYAFQAGKIDVYPFNGVHIVKSDDEDIQYLTMSQLDAIKEKKITIPRLQQVRDIWLFQCFTGLSYVDMANLVPADFKKNENGQYYVCKRRQKTGVEFTAVLLQDATAIALKYGFKLPVKSNQKYNAYLKEIADLCDLKDEDGNRIKLHSHMARHTCAMYLLNHRDPVVPNETIIKVMGWKNDKQLRHYARLVKETVFDDMAKLETPEEKFSREILEILMEDD